jgi:hypothetical protein
MDSYILTIRIKLLFCLISGLGLGVIAYIDYQASSKLLTLSTLTLSGLLILNALFLMTGYIVKTAGYFDRLLIIIVGLYPLIASEYGHAHNIYWIYFYPITAFFLFKLKPAIYMVLAYIPVALYIITQVAPPLHEAQIIFSLAVISTVSLFLAMVKSRTNKLLEPLVGRDIHTGAQLEQFLRPALSIEIIRAEREGTGLLLMHIQTPPNKKNASKEECEERAAAYAKAISKHLRLFDQYYRINNQNFSIILPHATSQEAKEIAKKIVRDANIAHSENTSFGFASLNVDDTSDSLIQLSQQELIHVSN